MTVAMAMSAVAAMTTARSAVTVAMAMTTVATMTALLSQLL